MDDVSPSQTHPEASQKRQWYVEVVAVPDVIDLAKHSDEVTGGVGGGGVPGVEMHHETLPHQPSQLGRAQAQLGQFLVQRHTQRRFLGSRLCIDGTSN